MTIKDRLEVVEKQMAFLLAVLAILKEKGLWSHEDIRKLAEEVKATKEALYGNAGNPPSK